MRRQLLSSSTALAHAEPIDAAEYRHKELARQLVLLLGTHEVETYVSPNGYKLKKITRCPGCENGHALREVI